MKHFESPSTSSSQKVERGRPPRGISILILEGVEGAEAGDEPATMGGGGGRDGGGGGVAPGKTVADGVAGGVGGGGGVGVMMGAPSSTKGS